MASILSLFKSALNIKHFIIENGQIVDRTVSLYKEEFKRKEIHLKVRPYKRDLQRCPICKKQCSKYDSKRMVDSSWRTANLNGIPVYLEYRPSRISCPEHGIKTEYIPWADGTGRFTEDFNNEAAWLITQMSKTAISTLLGINWRTVGNCVKSTLDRLEPCLEDRVHCGLKRICVDETSYKKGHSYITVVYDMDRNRVVWIKEKHGEAVFKEFCELLTEEERISIEIVAGDGARWIDACTRNYFPNAKRCVDFFHVVSWANEVLDEIRSSTASKARKEYNAQKKQYQEEESKRQDQVVQLLEKLKDAKNQLAEFPRRGRPSAAKKALLEHIAEIEQELDKLQSDEEATSKRGRPRKERFSADYMAHLDELMKRAERIKGAKYALSKNPENRTENQTDMLNFISVNCPDLYQAWMYKEALRVILHMKDPELAEKKLTEWIGDTAGCELKEIQTFSEKIARHKNNILNSVRYQVNSSKSEATNTTIKALIKTARGFRNLGNMFALIYLKCSDLTVPLHNRPQADAAMKSEQRERAMHQKQVREAGKMQFGV